MVLYELQNIRPLKPHRSAGFFRALPYTFPTDTRQLTPLSHLIDGRETTPQDGLNPFCIKQRFDILNSFCQLKKILKFFAKYSGIFGLAGFI